MNRAIWICVKCGFLNRCEVAQYSTDPGIEDCPPLGCLQGMIKNKDPYSDKSSWELVE
jgi:hypothetical protein